MPRPEMTAARMAELYDTGLTLAQVGEIAGVSGQTVAVYLQSIGVQRRPRGGGGPVSPECRAASAIATSARMKSEDGVKIRKLAVRAARSKSARDKAVAKLRVGVSGRTCSWCGEPLGHIKLSEAVKWEFHACNRHHSALARNNPMQSHRYRSQVRPEFWRMQRDLLLTDAETFEAAGVELPWVTRQCSECNVTFKTLAPCVTYCTDECRRRAHVNSHRMARAKRRIGRLTSER